MICEMRPAAVFAARQSPRANVASISSLAASNILRTRFHACDSLFVNAYERLQRGRLSCHRRLV
jgi:hypothetical protein